MTETVTKHPFKSWLRERRLSHEWAGASLDVVRLTLHRYFTGQRPMPGDLKLKVEKLTEGAVRARDIAGWELDRLQQRAAA